MKKILVTGGFGFVGINLVKKLLEEKTNFIHVVDNLTTNPLPFQFTIDLIGYNKNLTYDLISVTDFCKTNTTKYDEIYHLASIVGPAGVLKHSGNIVRMIVDDTYSLIELCLKYNCRMVDVSTSEIYGGGREGYCSEEMSKIITNKTSARLEYAIGKLASETALINTATSTNLNAVILRPFNISGPTQSGVGGFVLPRFIAQAIRNHKLTVFGLGNQIRAFTHVKDIVSGIILAMDHGKPGEAYNIGNPANKTTILELAEKVIQLTKSRSTITFVDPKELYGPRYEEANDKFPNASRAFEELHWTPQYQVNEIITDTFEFMRNLPEDIFESIGALTIRK